VWFDRYFGVYFRRAQHVQLAKDFLSAVRARERLPVVVRFLEKTMERRIARGTYRPMSDHTLHLSDAPKVILPKGVVWRVATILDIDSLEVARQLTLQDFHAYADLDAPVVLSWLKSIHRARSWRSGATSPLQRVILSFDHCSR
jgi:hypothetical protein